MAKSGVHIDLKGFEKQLADLQKMGENVDKAASKAIKDSARIVESELRAEATASGVPASVTEEIEAKVTGKDDRYTAEIGWELGSYSSKNPSVGYIAMFLNYGAVRGGTENRKTRRGQNRGKLQARQFIERAKKAAKPKIKRQMKKIIEEVNEN